MLRFVLHSRLAPGHRSRSSSSALEHGHVPASATSTLQARRTVSRRDLIPASLAVVINNTTARQFLTYRQENTDMQKGRYTSVAIVALIGSTRGTGRLSLLSSLERADHLRVRALLQADESLVHVSHIGVQRGWVGANVVVVEGLFRAPNQPAETRSEPRRGMPSLGVPASNAKTGCSFLSPLKAYGTLNWCSLSLSSSR